MRFLIVIILLIFSILLNGQNKRNDSEELVYTFGNGSKPFAKKEITDFDYQFPLGISVSTKKERENGWSSGWSFGGLVGLEFGGLYSFGKDGGEDGFFGFEFLKFGYVFKKQQTEVFSFELEPKLGLNSISAYHEQFTGGGITFFGAGIFFGKKYQIGFKGSLGYSFVDPRNAILLSSKLITFRISTSK